MVDGEFQVSCARSTAVGVQAPAVVRNYLDDLAQRSLQSPSCPTLPFGLTLDQVSAEPDGLAVTATGRDVPAAWH